MTPTNRLHHRIYRAWRYIVEVWKDSRDFSAYRHKCEAAHREHMKVLEREYLLELCRKRYAK